MGSGNDGIVRRKGAPTTLRVSLQGSLVLLAVVLILVGGAGMYFTASMASQVSRAATGSTPAIHSLYSLEVEVQHLCDAVEQYAHDASPTTQEPLEHGTQELSDILASYNDLDHVLPTDLIQKELQRAIDDLTGLIEMVTTGDVDGEERAQMLIDLRAVERKIEGLVRSGINFQSQRVAMAGASARASLIVAWVITAAGVLLGIAVVMLAVSSLRRAITLPIRRLCEAAEQVGGGNLSVRTSGRVTPEFAKLCEQFDAMVEQLAARHGALQGEIDRRLEAEAQLRHDAMHDDLTGLLNRAVLFDQLRTCIERAKRDKSYRYALLFLDLDRFKVINDSLGHNIGDELLVEASKRLKLSVRGLDTVVRVDQDLTARLGGDEFAILLDGIANTGRVVLIAERIQAALSRPFHIAGHELTINTSIGIAIGESGDITANDLLRQADTAMYRAKMAGGAQHAVFDDVMQADVRQRLELENDLRKAVERQEFRIQYQPIIDLQNGEIAAFEALIRWQHPEHGLISPAKFIPLAEETGLIVPIGGWMLREACRQLKAWRRELPPEHRLSISVNVSPRQVQGFDLVNEVERVLKETDVHPSHLRLEITESMIMENADSIRDTLCDLKSLGVALHMDDFGTGYSSLSCLHNFPLDLLKIDREFVRNMDEDSDYAAVVRSIMMLAHNLRMQVTAEGIETEKQLEMVKTLQCHYGQGYLFSKPVEPADAWKMITQNLPVTTRKSA